MWNIGSNKRGTENHPYLREFLRRKLFSTKLFWYLNMIKWYVNHRHNWSFCHDLRFWISFYFLWGWEPVEYSEIPPFCVYAMCLNQLTKLARRVINNHHLVICLHDQISSFPLAVMTLGWSIKITTSRRF